MPAIYTGHPRGRMSCIRLASTHEADELSGLARRSKAFWGYSADFMAACTDELTVSPQVIADGHVYVLDACDRVAGFYSLQRCNAKDVELEHLFLDPAVIGQGYGRCLMRHAMSEANRRGYRRLLIQGDPNATQFYLGCGARQIGDRESDSIPGRLLPLFEVRLGGPALGLRGTP